MTKSYVDIISQIRNAGWLYGDFYHVEAGTGKGMFVAEAHKNGQRCVARAETLQTALMRLQAMIEKVEKRKPR